MRLEIHVAYIMKLFFFNLQVTEQPIKRFKEKLTESDLYFIFKIFIYLEKEKARGRSRGRVRVLSKLCTERGAQYGAQSHNPERIT